MGTFTALLSPPAATEWVTDATTTIGWFLRHPALQLLTVAFLVAGWWAARGVTRRGAHPRVAAGVRWATWGIGVAVIPTFAARVGYYPLTWTAAWDAVCATGTVTDWFTANSVLNLVLLMPLVVGVASTVHPTSPSRFLATAGIAAFGCAVAVEMGQAISGLGVCQDGDVVRNATGAFLAALVVAGIRDQVWPDPPLAHAQIWPTRSLCVP